MTDEYKIYVGKFSGMELKGTGTNKEGKEWTRYRLLFLHGDNKNPSFSWFNPIDQLQIGKMYRVVFVENPFTNDQGTEVIMKKAIKVEDASVDAKEGFQQATQQQQATSTPELIDSDKFIVSYQEQFPKDQWNKYHFIVTYTLNRKPELGDVYGKLIEIFEKGFKEDLTKI